MKKRASVREWLPRARGAGTGEGVPTGEAFRPEWIDFERGVRVGNLEPHERITRILKYHLEQRHDTRFITDRWGRGVYWQWICWLPVANREAKPLSHSVNFGCAKFFISADGERRIFQSGLQIERGYAEGRAPYPGCQLESDWDWHRLMKQAASGTVLDRELKRLLGREGFVVEVGDWGKNLVLNAGNFTSARQIRAAARKAPPRGWAGFQIYYPMPAEEVCACSGYELVKAICAVFAEVTPAMNVCMQVPLTGRMTSPDPTHTT